MYLIGPIKKLTSFVMTDVNELNVSFMSGSGYWLQPIVHGDGYNVKLVIDASMLMTLACCVA